MQHGAMTDVNLDAWAIADPDPMHHQTYADWRSQGVPADAATPLRFGTAGLRGEMGPGPGRMNRVVVRVAARALGRELVASGLAPRGVVVGHDARPHSDEYALDSARLLRALGVPCILIDGPTPTPVLAFTALSRGAAAAVMVTASHNPRDDNGYKVYWSDGAQIRSPIDSAIEARMEFDELPTEAALAPRHDVESVSPRVAMADYLGSVITERTDEPSPHVVYTALCGVGADAIDMAFATAGLRPPVHVESQRHPDGRFPGLPFPNPEEPGTLDRAFETADEHGADLVVANDPDADRLGVAVRTSDGWRTLTGDEIGVLLCDRRIATTSGDDRVAASSVVSGSMVPALCAAREVDHVTTLTGFKWIMRPAIDRSDDQWIFGYEEALGFSVTDRVRDKDGISAAVEFVRLAAALDARGATVLDRLDELSRELGTFTNRQVSLRGDRDAIDAALAALRADPPTSLGGVRVTAVDDWSTRPGDQATDLVILTLDGGGRAAIRPSGTEPKVKAYLEWRHPAGGDPTTDRAEAAEILDRIATDVRALFA